jgi:hypothetical protein
MHRNKQLKLFNHVVGAGEQKMRACDLAEFGSREESKFPESILRMRDRDRELALMQPEDSVHRA